LHDVAEAVARVAIESPLNCHVEVAGPERFRMDEFFRVDSFDQPHWLLWRSRARSWAWRLTPLTDERTRLIARLNTYYDWRRPGTLVTVLLMEFGDYAMMRRMLCDARL